MKIHTLLVLSLISVILATSDIAFAQRTSDFPPVIPLGGNGNSPYRIIDPTSPMNDGRTYHVDDKRTRKTEKVEYVYNAKLHQLELLIRPAPDATDINE